MPSTSTPSRSRLAVLKRHKVAVGVAAWALLIGVFALFTPSVTVREQTSPADALPRLDQAVGDAAGLLAGKPYGFSLTALTSEGGCDITPVRSGQEYSRTVTVYTGKKDAAAAVDDLYEGLKKRYRLEPAAFVKLPTFNGISDDYVEFELRQDREYIVWRATTGCRPAADAVGELSPAFAPAAQSVVLLKKLGVDAPDWSSASTDCGDLAGPGGTASTATATGKLPKDADTDVTALADKAPEGSKIAVASKKLVSYRLEGVTHTVSLDGRAVTVTATQGCDGKSGD